eukprot:jgi/Ulvmu1/7203/UM034_0112.1
MLTSFSSLVTWTSCLQKGRAQFRRQGTKVVTEARNAVVGGGSTRAPAGPHVRAGRHTPPNLTDDILSSKFQFPRLYTAQPQPLRPPSGRPSQAKAGEDPVSHSPPPKRRKRRRSSRRPTSRNQKPKENNASTQELCAKPVVGVTSLLLRGTSICAPSSTPAALTATPPGRRSHVARDCPAVPAPSNGNSNPLCSGTPGKAPAPPRGPQAPTSSLADRALRSAQHLLATPTPQSQPPWHCALWRVTQCIYQPVKDAVAFAFPYLQLLMPLPPHDAVPQPALTVHNAHKQLPESINSVWPLSEGSLLAASAEQVRAFPYVSSNANTAHSQFESRWKLGRFADQKILPQVWSGDLISSIRASHPAVMHASHSNRIALQVIDCSATILRAVEKWPSAGESSRVAMELRRMVELAATLNLAALPASHAPSGVPRECQLVLDHLVQLCLAVGRSQTHVPACSKAPQMLWHAMHGGFAGAAGGIQPLSLPRLLSILQALVALGTSCKHTRKLIDLVALLAPRAIDAAAAESMSCQQPRPLVQLTWWDWVRFYVPQMGLWQGLRAASIAPAPVQHTRGLALLLPSALANSHATQERAPVHLCVPSASSFKARECIPWSMHAAAGARPLADSVTLLMHELLTARLCQVRDAEADMIAPATFADKARAVVTEQDRRVFARAYAALHAFSGQRTQFPHRLLMSDRVARSLCLLDGAPAAGAAEATGAAEAWCSVRDAHENKRSCGAVKAQWAALSISPKLLDGAAAQAHLSSLQRMSPGQPPLRAQLQQVLDAIRESSETEPRLAQAAQDLPVMRLGDVADDASDEEVMQALVDTLQGFPKFERTNTLILTRLRQQSVQWVIDSVAEMPESMRFGRLLVRLAPSSHSLVRGADDLSNADIARRLTSLQRSNSGRDNYWRPTKHAALCSVFQAAATIVNIQSLDPRQQAALMRLIDSDPRCTAVKERLRPSRKADSAMRGMLKLLNTQLLDAQTYLALQEATACAAHVAQDLPQRPRLESRLELSQGGWLESWRCLGREAREVVAAAGSAQPVARCQVTREMESAAGGVGTGALEQGALSLPEDLEMWCSNTVNSARGTPSELQKKIHSAFQLMGFSVMKEHQVGALPMHLDIVTKGQGNNGERHTVAVEVDGPSHFLHSAAGPHALNAATRFRNAALLLHNVHVIPVSYTVWDRVGISGQGLHHEVNQRSWLRSELRKRGIVFPVRQAPRHNKK